MRGNRNSILTLLPIIDGISPSCVTIHEGRWENVLDFLQTRFPAISAQEWMSRIERGRVLDRNGRRIDPYTPCKTGMRLFYYREIEREFSIPFRENILFEDEHLIVVDKPHFLPVTPSGTYLRETVLTRLKVLGENSIVPLHRIDKDTAGVVVFSRNPRTRGKYASLFQKQAVKKIYEAIAPSLPADMFPMTYRSRIVTGEPFFRMKEAEGVPNSETRISIIRTHGSHTTYRLIPVTGRKHQLRLHLSALKVPILNDHLYPNVQFKNDFSRPLQLIARSVSFEDPLSGSMRYFKSERSLSFESG